MSLHLFLVVAMILCSLAAVMARRTIHAALFLALVSILLAAIMFGAKAPWAGVFELSVCAGLITVLFASTASMVGRGKSYAKREEKFFRWRLPLALIVFGVIVWAASAFFSPALKPVDGAAAPSLLTAGEIIWNFRTPDLLGQLCIFVAGVLTVRTMLGEGGDE